MAESHDRLVRVILEDPVRTAEILDRLPEKPFPWGPVEGRLNPRPAVLVDADLQRSEPDFVFEIARMEEEESETLPRDLVLIEHQSRPDPTIIFRALVHLTTLVRKAYKRSGSFPQVPRMHVVVLYHGKSPWTAPQDLRALHAKGSDELVDLNFRIHVIDLAVLTDRQIRERLGEGATALLALLLKHGRSGAVREKLPEWDAQFRATLAEPDGFEVVRAAVWYLFLVSDIEAEEVKALPFARGSRETQSMIKTTGEKLREEGRKIGLEQGLEQGMERGLERGRRQGLRDGLLTLLATRFGEVPPALRRRIEGAEVDALKAMLRRAVAAASLEDLASDDEA